MGVAELLPPVQVVGVEGHQAFRDRKVLLVSLPGGLGVPLEPMDVAHPELGLADAEQAGTVGGVAGRELLGQRQRLP